MEDLAPASAETSGLRENPSLRSGSSEGDDGENTRLLSSAMSDDGYTPLIREPNKAVTKRTRWRQALHLLRSVLKFLLVNWYKFIILGVIITLIVLVSVKGFSIFGVILRWFQARNNWGGWGIFVGMYTGLVALFLPGVVFIMGAGFVFGFWKGLLAVWVGGAVGQALAFLLARYLLRGWVESTIKGRWRKWEYIDKAIEIDGWKLVLIMRFSPIIPYNLLNIAMATTSMPFWQFTMVSSVGIIFECAVFCYFGSMAENITSIISGDAGPAAAIEWVLLGLSLVMCVFGAIFVSISIKRAIKKAERRVNSSPAADGRDDGGFESPSALPMSLERESFLGNANAFIRVPDSTSPSLELKPVPRAANGSGSKLKLSPRASSERVDRLAINPNRRLELGGDLEMGPREPGYSAPTRRPSIHQHSDEE